MYGCMEFKSCIGCDERLHFKITAIEFLPQHKLMVQATQLALQQEKSAHCVLEKTKFGLQEKCHNLSEARARLAHLQHKLQCACAECAATKQAAHCACEAARAACGNARRKRHGRSRSALAVRAPDKTKNGRWLIKQSLWLIVVIVQAVIVPNDDSSSTRELEHSASGLSKCYP